MSIYAPTAPPKTLYLEDEGTQLPIRSRFDFQGTGVTASDDATNGQTIITIPGGGGSVDWAAAGIYRPQDYGTVDPTGITDSRAAFQAAIDALLATNYGGTVVCPPGRFKIGSPGLTFWSPPYDRDHGFAYGFAKRFVGAGRGATVLVASKTMTEPVLTVTTRLSSTPSTIGAGFPGHYIADLTISTANWWDSTSTFRTGIGYSNTGLTSGALMLQETSYGVVERVVVDCYVGENFPYTPAPLGVNVVDCLCNVYRDFTVTNAARGIKFTEVEGFTCNHTALHNVYIMGSSTWCIDWQQAGTPLLIQGLDTETSSGGGVRYDGAGSGNVELRGPLYWESISAMTHLDVDASLARISGPNQWLGGTIQNRGTTQLLIEDYNFGSITCVNASGATLQKVRASGVTGSGGTTTTWH